MMHGKNKTILIIFSLFLLNFLFYNACVERNTNGKENYDSFRWKKRLEAPEIKKLPAEIKKNRYKEMDMDLFILPEKEDVLLSSCSFYIEIGYCYGEQETIYCGPYKNRILIKSVPYLAQDAEITFMAYNEKTKIFQSWKSKKYHKIFINNPLVIELYDEYNNETEAWFKIYSR